MNGSAAGSPALRRLVYLAVSVFVVLFDQGTKAVISVRIPLHTSVGVIPGLFDLTHVQNTGAAFGLFASLGSPLRSVALNAVAFLVFLGVLVYALKTPVWSTRLQTAFALILGGAVGNLIDRIRFGSVTDFLEVYLGTHHWPTFNVADSAISIGVCLLALDLWRKPGEEPKSSERTAAA